MWPSARKRAATGTATPVITPARASEAITGWPLKSVGHNSPLFAAPERFTSNPTICATIKSESSSQTSHFGTMRSSSQKRGRSFFLRKRISRMRSFHEPEMPCPVVLINVPRRNSLGPSLGQDSLELLRAAAPFENDRSGGNQRGHGPPQNDAQFPHGFGKAGLPAHPLESAPNPRRGGDSEGPGDRSDGPQECSAGGAFAELLRAQAHAELRAVHEAARHFGGHAAERRERLFHFASEGRAAFAFREMRREPEFLLARDSFHALLRDQFLRANVKIGVHNAPPSPALSVIAPRMASSPRYSRDFTVEIGVLSTAAISSSCISSWKRSTSTSRYTAGSFPSEACTPVRCSSARTSCSGVAARSSFTSKAESSPVPASASRLCGFFRRCQSRTRLRAMAKSHASNFHLPSYWWPRSSTRTQVSWKKSSARSRFAVRCSR